MRTSILSKYKWLLIVAFTGLNLGCLAGRAWAGNGSDRGGGGGLYDSSELGWHSLAGPGKVASLGYAEEMAAFKTFHASIPTFVPCKNYPDLQAPGAIPAIDGFFEFRVENPRSFLESTIQGSRDVVAFTKSKLCSSPELIMSYGRFRMVMAEAAETVSDPFSVELLQKTVEKGGRIPLVITDHDFQLKTQSGHEPIDFTVYDPAGQQIFWHSLPEREMKSADPLSTLGFIEMQRQPLAFLRHEVTHLLLNRVMGSKYPLHSEIHYGRNPTTEDCRACEGKYCQCEPHGDEESSYLSWVTNPQAALIEGICDWTEMQRDGYAHPYLVGGMVFRANSRPNGEVCYGSFGPADFSTLESNEAHINTALRALVVDYYRDSGGNNIRAEVNRTKRSALLDVIAQSAPTSIASLSAAYDLQHGGQDSVQWSRQYFAEDYLSGAEIRKSLTARESGNIFEYCMPASAASVWFKNPLE